MAVQADQIVKETLQGLPEPERGGAGQPGPVMDAMKALKLPVGQKYSTFFVAAAISDQITDPDEQAKAVKDECRRLSNRFAGISKRITAADKNFKYAFRTENQTRGDASTPMGIRVYRIAPDGAANKK